MEAREKEQPLSTWKRCQYYISETVVHLSPVSDNYIQNTLKLEAGSYGDTLGWGRLLWRHTGLRQVPMGTHWVEAGSYGDTLGWGRFLWGHTGLRQVPMGTHWSLRQVPMGTHWVEAGCYGCTGLRQVAMETLGWSRLIWDTTMGGDTGLEQVDMGHNYGGTHWINITLSWE